MSAQTIVFPNSHEGARLRVVGDTVRVLATNAETDRQFEVFEVNGPRDSGPPPHAHPWSEAYLIVSGSMEVLVGEHASDVGSGGFAHIPAGMIHAYRITSDEARFYVITGPGHASQLFIDLDATTNFDEVVRAALKNGLTVPGVPTAPAAS